ncbi:hypothetical protein FLAG1_11469 [Fusarium langsethiae]|uniref:Uncharacterized protein n=1 Tax=Fusarium langsethiae TaxID=179993 RepID=A0A0M9EM12_FUSLA|nr:hypothetical protein FLAG1_11469 [Fusarium langsethiae]
MSNFETAGRDYEHIVQKSWEPCNHDRMMSWHGGQGHIVRGQQHTPTTETVENVELPKNTRLLVMNTHFKMIIKNT